MGNPPKFKRALYRPNPDKRGARVWSGGEETLFSYVGGEEGRAEELES